MLMALLAVVTSAAAWYFYPQIEAQQVEAERTQLLTESDAFEPRDIRKVRIEQFDRSRNRPTEFEMRFVNGSWVIPAHGDYPANNSERVPEILVAFRDKEVLETVSDKKEDHEKYGVLDTSETGATGLGAGTVLTFEGRNRKRLGQMIVGSSPEGNPEQRYVRLAGQPQIYVVEFDSSILTTNFADWVDGGLIRLGDVTSEQLVNQIDHVNIDLYFQDSNKNAKRKNVYRARIKQAFNGDWNYEIWTPDDDQGMSDEATSSGTIRGEQLKSLSGLVSKVYQVSLRNVARKQESAAIDLAGPKESQPASHFDSLRNFGFYHAGFGSGQHLFDSAAGELEIGYRMGLVSHVNIGTLDVDVSGAGGSENINRFVMLTASVDPTIIPEPEKPGQSGNSEDENSGGNQESAEDQNRNYQAAMQQRDAALALASQLAKSYNQLHADWVYVLPDDAIQRLMPPLDSWVKKAD